MEDDDKHSKTDDGALFRDAVGDVKPVAQRRRSLPRRMPKPHAKFSRAEEKAVLDESLTAGPDPADVETGEELLFQRADVSRRVMRQLRRGQFSIQDEIDLHGLKRDEAHDALREFVAHCQVRGFYCVRVVHGKGIGSGPRGPVIKSGVNRWLRRWAVIAAFCTALPNDGGTGAIYVLLNKSKR